MYKFYVVIYCTRIYLGLALALVRRWYCPTFVQICSDFFSNIHSNIPARRLYVLDLYRPTFVHLRFVPSYICCTVRRLCFLGLYRPTFVLSDVCTVRRLYCPTFVQPDVCGSDVCTIRYLWVRCLYWYL